MAAKRVLHIDLGALERAPAAPRAPFLGKGEAPAPAGAWATLADWGGTGLGLACLHARVRAAPDAPAPFVIAVGEAVRAGLPTAARAAVLSRAPLSGLYAEGHVGGELAARLARVADALVLEGRCERAGSVLVVEADGTCMLLARPELQGVSPADTARALATELGPCAVLAIGAAGERGLPFASLASGHAPPSFVGRGGLGARFGALGLKALCVRAAPVAGAQADAAELVAQLRASPRLRARAEGGTLELFDAWAARGALEPELGHALAGEARARADARHGCRGCPTPCGWTFERSDGGRQGARFGASHALGAALGLASLDDALHLLGICDRLGVDAKEVGAVLALRCTAEERGLLPGKSARGSRAALAERVEELVADIRAPGRDGAAELARALGLADEFPSARGQAVRPETDRAALLGQCVASGGADPMRSFPFLLESADHGRLAELLAPLPVPREALDPRSAVAKGRLVFWHENLISAVDMTGFCAFSAAGLLTDGACDVDALARWILPAALRTSEDERWRALPLGARLLAAGANLVLARHALNRLWSAPDELEELDRPRFARAELDEPGMLDEYRALRGLDARGTPGAAAVAALGTPQVLALGALAHEPAATSTRSAARRARARVTLSSGGALAELLGPRCELELELPDTVAGVLEALARHVPDARLRLVAAGAPVPTVWRAGKRLLADDEVSGGDALDLVIAIGGG